VQAGQNSKGSAGKHSVHNGQDLQAFLQHWNLNEDAAQKLSKMAAPLQQQVIATFQPPPHMTEVSGKFIMFAASLEKGPPIHFEQMQGPPTPKGAGKAMRIQLPVVSKGAAKAPVHHRERGVQGGSKGGKGAADPRSLEAFCQHWALNEDARSKLYGMPPALQACVMNEFSPPPHMTEVNGKFILFAASKEKHALGSLQHAQSFVNPADAFAQHWGLNEDAQTKLHKLSPDVRQSVMSTFLPPPHMTEVSGKFIMFAASLERPAGRSSVGQKGGGPFFGQKRKFT